jgi:hypothetical protein
MPELDDKNKGAGGENNGAGAGAGNGQNAGGADTVTIKKTDLDKINSDLENYKSMGGKYKDSAEKWEAHEKSEKERIEKEKQNQNNQGQNQMDESRVGEITERKIREANQKTAQNLFFKGFKEEDKNAVLAELHLSGKETTVEEITDRLDAALLESKRKTGKLDEYLKSGESRAHREGFTEGQINQAHGYGGAGDRNEQNKEGTLTPKGEEMARAMHTDPEKVKKVDPQKDNVIDILKPKKK